MSHYLASVALDMRATRRGVASAAAQTGTKVCHRCKRRKPLTAFWRRTGSADGRDPWCIGCRGSYFRRWCAANRD